jgi:hypothetical protein
VSAPVVLDQDSREQSERDARAQAQDTPSLLDAAKAAVQNEWVMSWALLGAGVAEPDPDFVMTPEFHRQLAEGVPKACWDSFDAAVSQEYALALREDMLQSLKNDQDLAKLGWGGVGLRLLAAMLDPVGITASVATEGLAAPLVAAGKLSRLGRVALGGYQCGDRQRCHRSAPTVHTRCCCPVVRR